MWPYQDVVLAEMSNDFIDRVIELQQNKICLRFTRGHHTDIGVIHELLPVIRGALGGAADVVSVIEYSQPSPDANFILCKLEPKWVKLPSHSGRRHSISDTGTCKAVNLGKRPSDDDPPTFHRTIEK